MSDQAIGSEVGRKISVKELGWDKASILQTVLANTDEKHPLARFMGVASGVKPYKIKEGERAGEVAYGLMGQFEGENLITGEALQGSVLYLPGYVNDMVVAALTSSDDVASVRIAFDIYAAYDKDTATSYVFTANDLLNTRLTGVDEVKEALKALPKPAAVAALPAPKK